MTVIEICMVTIAVASAVVGVTAALLAVRLQPVLRRSETVLDNTRDLLVRLERATGDVESILRDARRVENRIARSADRILDEVEPPLRLIPALLSGVRATVAAFVRGHRATTPAGQPGSHEPTTREIGD